LKGIFGFVKHAFYFTVSFNEELKVKLNPTLDLSSAVVSFNEELKVVFACYLCFR